MMKSCRFAIVVVSSDTNILSRQQNGLAALVSEEVCNHSSLALGYVGCLEAKQIVTLAEAESIALFHGCVVYALWSTWGKKQPIGAFLDLYMARLLRKVQHRFGDVCLTYFKDIFVSREAEFMREFPKMGTGDAALPSEGPLVKDTGAAAVRLAGRWVRRVQGTYDDSLEQRGVHAGTSIAPIAAFFQLATTAILSDSKLFRSMQGLFQ